VDYAGAALNYTWLSTGGALIEEGTPARGLPVRNSCLRRRQLLKADEAERVGRQPPMKG